MKEYIVYIPVVATAKIYAYADKPDKALANAFNESLEKYMVVDGTIEYAEDGVVTVDSEDEYDVILTDINNIDMESFCNA